MRGKFADRKVPKLLFGTLSGALIGAVVINPCNGAAAVVGLCVGFLADVESMLRKRWADQSVRTWIACGWISRGPIVSDRVVGWVVGLTLMAMAIGLCLNL